MILGLFLSLKTQASRARTLFGLITIALCLLRPAMCIWPTVICLSWPQHLILSVECKSYKAGTSSYSSLFVSHRTGKCMPFALNYMKTNSDNSLSILMTGNQTLFSHLPLHSWSAIMGWLKRTVSSTMSSKNVVGWKIWCKLSGLKIWVLSPELEILQMELKCDSKMWFSKNDSNSK